MNTTIIAFLKYALIDCYEKNYRLLDEEERNVLSEAEFIRLLKVCETGSSDSVLIEQKSVKDLLKLEYGSIPFKVLTPQESVMIFGNEQTYKQVMHAASK